MLKRRPIDLQINHERWLVSYADFVTLLFAFFVVMYSVSHVNEKKYQELSATLNEVFSDSFKNEFELDTEVISDSESDEGKKMMALPILADSFYRQLAPLIEDGSIEVTSNEFWLQISLNNRILFDVGSVKPIQQANRVIANIAVILSGTQNPINVEGFTDNVAINTTQFPSNWQLSTARAAAIVQLLVANGVEPEQLSAVGYGEFQPIADNNSASGRAKNRRVSILIGKHQQQRPVATVGSSDGEVDIIEESYNSDNLTKRLNQQTVEDLTSQSKEKETMEPITLGNGELLFTSDPAAPR
jgi:chemotaxis protein MotB